MRAYESSLTADPAWTETALRITRERMRLHRHPEAVARALREVPRSLPFEGIEELETLDVPAAGRRQLRRGRSRAPLLDRRGVGGPPAAGAPRQRGEGQVAARLAGRAALASDRGLPGGAAESASGSASRDPRGGSPAGGPTRSRRSRRPCCRPGGWRARVARDVLGHVGLDAGGALRPGDPEPGRGSPSPVAAQAACRSSSARRLVKKTITSSGPPARDLTVTPSGKLAKQRRSNPSGAAGPQKATRASSLMPSFLCERRP